MLPCAPGELHFDTFFSEKYHCASIVNNELHFDTFFSEKYHCASIVDEVTWRTSKCDSKRVVMCEAPAKGSGNINLLFSENKPPERFCPSELKSSFLAAKSNSTRGFDRPLVGPPGHPSVRLPFQPANSSKFKKV